MLKQQNRNEEHRGRGCPGAFFAPGGALTGPQRQRAEKNNIAGQPDLCYDYEKLPQRRINGPLKF